MSRPEADRGAGTILVLGVMSILIVAGLVVLVGTQLVLARTKAHAAADLAALAAADRTFPGDVCARAEQVATENSGALTNCRIDGENVTVEVTVVAGNLATRLARLAGGDPPHVRGTARAGPQE